MITLHPGFRRLVLKNIPELDSEDLNDYDSLLAYRWQLEHEKSLVPGKVSPEPKPPQPPAHEEPPIEVDKVSRSTQHPTTSTSDGSRSTTPRDEVVRLISTATRLANSIIDDYRPQFDKLHELWTARRNVALRQGGMLQIPRNGQELTTLAGALGTYYWVQIKTFPTLAISRIKNFPWRTWVLVGVFVSVALLALASLDDGTDRKDPRPPQPPDSTQVRP
ncbi:MAG: hypothetical protein AAB354_10150 [candidate division KSB1 bacterium]